MADEEKPVGEDLIFKVNSMLEEEEKGLLECALENPKWFYEKIFPKVLNPKTGSKADKTGVVLIGWETE